MLTSKYAPPGNMLHLAVFSPQLGLLELRSYKLVLKSNILLEPLYPRTLHIIGELLQILLEGPCTFC